MPQTNGLPSIEQKLLSLIAGQDLGDITQELCDFSLEEQNATAEAQGIQPTASSDFIPVIGKTVTYIVACVLFNENNEVLAMQEAKQSCAGMQTEKIYVWRISFNYAFSTQQGNGIYQQVAWKRMSRFARQL